MGNKNFKKKNLFVSRIGFFVGEQKLFCRNLFASVFSCQFCFCVGVPGFFV